MPKHDRKRTQAREDQPSGARVAAGEPGEPDSMEEMRRLVQELHVYRAELEAQNDELRRSREEVDILHHKFAHLYEEAPVGYFTLDENCVVVDANKTACEQLGMRRDRLQGKPLFLFLGEQDRRVFQCLCLDALASEQPVCREVRIAPRDAAPFPAILDGRASRDPNTGNVRVLLAVSDVSGQKVAEQELERSRELFRSLFELSQDGIVVVDGEGRFVQANPAACSLIGVPLERLLQMRVQDLRKPEGDDPAGNRCWGLTFSDPLRGQLRFVRPDGLMRTVEFSARELSNGLHMASLHDISDAKEAEEQLLQYSEHLEELVELRAERIRELERHRAQSEQLASTGRMAARIAHEINNPLAGIKNSFLLVKDAVPEDYPYYRYVGAIEKEIDRIARIVSQMFDLYQPEQEIPQRFNLQETVEDLVLMLQSLSRQRQVTVTTRLPEYPVILFLPEGLVRQVLYNLLANAIEASPPDAEVKVSAVPMGENISISVSDHGRGITEEVAAHLFEPFFTTKRAGFEEGVGLGLSVSRTLVEIMGGNLTYQSVVGEGTVFRVVLPQSLQS